MSAPKSITIVGGGASGLILAVHLLMHKTSPTRVTLIEKRGEPGRGFAYSAVQSDHVLNVPAARMSALAHDPDHFLRWLRKRHPELPDDPFLFAPRRLYGAYLADLLAEAAARAGKGRFSLVRAECRAINARPGGIEVVLSDGTSRVGQIAVLAVGHEDQPLRGHGLAVRAGSAMDTPLAGDAPVMILGSGLSMVDAWLSLAARRHRGRVTVVSRHGLLPLSHTRTEPLAIDAADVPFGTNLLYLTRWLRALVRENEAAGGDWRAAVDGLRPFNQRLWQSWSPRARHQFLEHARPFWNIHRHRLPPDLHARLRSAVVSRQVELVAGNFLDIERNGELVRASIRRRGTRKTEFRDVARVYDCGGVIIDVTESANPVIRHLLDQGLARPDPQRIGLDVTTDLRLVDKWGVPAQRLFAVGPLTRGTFFEIEAIPDIRRQCADLVEHLAA